ncbi:MAG: orotate phosphoribosyltransferase [Gemmatimonadaceae bacterium]
MSDSERLKELLIERSVKTGDFTLVSGKRSTYYIDARLTTMSPEGMAVIGRLGLDRLEAEQWNPDSVGGLTLGADPVAYAISHTSVSASRLVRAFTVRKEAKAHGTGKRIEGPFVTGDRVAVIEDVITTGKSTLDAIAAIERAGGHVVGVLAVVDRLEGGREALEQKGYRMVSLTTIAELGVFSDNPIPVPRYPAG